MEALAQADVKASAVAAIGITNQRETAIIWDRKTGEPIHNAIVWQDRRTAGFCDRLREQGSEPKIQQKTGLVIDAYFSASKICWLLDNVAGARERALRGELAFGTVDSWLIWKLTSGTRHVTDVTNASRTMLFNLQTGQWDDELLDLLNVPKSLLPEVVGSSEVCGKTSGVLAGIPIAGIAGDQQAALFGQMCMQPGMVKMHLRHRQFHAAQHRRKARAHRVTNCLLPLPGKSMDEPVTRSKAASSLRAPSCSGCATNCRSFAKRPKSKSWRPACPIPRRVFCARVFGSGRPALGSICPRHNWRPDARSESRSHCSRRARRYRVPGRRHYRRHGN